GVRAATVLAEILELAPFGKILFSSGARGLPELHVVGARLFHDALARVLGTWVAEGAWALPDAERVAGLLAEGSAPRVYGLEWRPAARAVPGRPEPAVTRWWAWPPASGPAAPAPAQGPPGAAAAAARPRTPTRTTRSCA